MTVVARLVDPFNHLAHVAAAIRRLEARDDAGANRAMNQAAAAKNRAYAAWRDMVANGFDHRAPTS